MLLLWSLLSFFFSFPIRESFLLKISAQGLRPFRHLTSVTRYLPKAALPFTFSPSLCPCDKTPVLSDLSSFASALDLSLSTLEQLRAQPAFAKS